VGTVLITERLGSAQAVAMGIAQRYAHFPGKKRIDFFLVFFSIFHQKLFKVLSFIAFS